MTTIATPTLFTPEDVLAFGDDGLYELIGGKLVEKNMSSMATKTAARVAAAISNHIDSQDLGEVYCEQSFQCFPDDAGRLRRPDVAFISTARLKDVPDEGHIKIVPDIAIEVVYPTDRIYELDEKLVDYQSAGVKLVWVVNPITRTIRIYRPDHSVTELIDTSRISGESVLPDFSAIVADLLPRKRKA